MRPRYSDSYIGIFVFAATSGCVSHMPSGSLDKVSGWAALSPVEMLREAGRLCCDANTFEAVGTKIGNSKTHSMRPVHFRWVFGPAGEYRFEHGGAGVIIFDTSHLAFIPEHPKEFMVDNMRDRVENTPIRGGRHNRYGGDMVMVTGMVADAMTYPTAAARLLGNDWPEATFLSNDVTLKFQEDETVNRHPCKKIRIRNPDSPGEMTIWIDVNLRVIRKWELRKDIHYKCAWFDQIRINTKLDPSVFEIPHYMLEKRKREKQ